MAETERKPARSGGVFIALGTVFGAVTGGLLGQPSIGLLSGLAGGSAIAGLMWLRDRRT